MVARDLLTSVFSQRRPGYGAALSEDDAFEVFCADLILNSFDPSISEIQDRIVDGGQDGGIDSIFIYVNRVLLSEDTDLTVFKSPVDIELLIIQSKNEDTFKEGPVDKVSASLPILMRDLSKTDAAIGKLKPSVIKAFGLWDKTLKTLAPEFPNIKVDIWYACKGQDVPPTALAKATALEKTIQGFFPAAAVKFHFAGSGVLYQLASQQKIVKADLAINGSPLSGNNSAYIVLVKLSDYGSFLSAPDGSLRASFFDANVRDYEGAVEVNRDIALTLRGPLGIIDFWWLNNGVTILATKAGFSNGKMILQNPLIVNGLQTSYELHRWVRTGGEDNKRLLMVRIVETTDEDVINKIIKATNYQTKVRQYSLRATEEVQRRIELFLFGLDIYYDRRRNYYKNLGKPSARTIGIDRMAQTVSALLLEKPDVARARPTGLMKPGVYEQLFPSGDDEHPLRLYEVAAEILFLATTALTSSNLDRSYKNNLRFHIVMVIGWWAGGSQNPTPAQLGAISSQKLKAAPVDAIISWVAQEYAKTDASDAVAKDGKFTEQLRDAWPQSGVS